MSKDADAGLFGYTREDMRRLFGETDEKDLPDFLSKALNQIDAAIYSGDALFDPKALRRFEFYLARWVADGVPYCKDISAEKQQGGSHA